MTLTLYSPLFFFFLARRFSDLKLSILSESHSFFTRRIFSQFKIAISRIHFDCACFRDRSRTLKHPNTHSISSTPFQTLVFHAQPTTTSFTPRSHVAATETWNLLGLYWKANWNFARSRKRLNATNQLLTFSKYLMATVIRYACQSPWNSIFLFAWTFATTSLIVETKIYKVIWSDLNR